ncbi:MAG: hypothetical protein COA43_11790 [Robiginitomaculum sp.]|nr:MAG: hypothetical protein COA43_11790 [Robiginitomaculum sp.]
MENFLTPVLALILWTFVMWAVMYWRRIPAMNAITKNTQEFIDDPKLGEQLPAKARWAADNYNHLHEQPVLFYALMGYLFMTEHTGAFFLNLAWAYVIIRIVHSLLQITSNRVVIRFGLFVLGSLCLIAMAVRAALYLF